MALSSPRYSAAAVRRHRRRWPGAGARGLALAGLLGALAGCAIAPLPALDQHTADGWRNASGEADTGTPAPDLRRWWLAFSDPQLDRLVDEALAGNLGIRQAELRIQGARVLSQHGNAEFLPEFGIRTYAEPTPDSSASYFQAGFDAKWELGFFGRAKAHARVLAGDLGIAESDTQSARVSVVAEVARAYIELRGAEQRLALLQQIGTAAARKSALTATRVRLHLAAAAEQSRSVADEAAAAATLYEPTLAIERARQQLGVLVGRSDLSVDATAPLPRLGDLRITQAPADLLRTRPEIRRAENEVLKAAGELGLARSDLYPHIGLGGSLTYAARVIGNTRLADAAGIVTFGPAIDIPLFDWGARRAIADARDAELQARVLAYRQAVLDGVAEAETSMAALEAQRGRAVALQRGLVALQEGEDSSATLQRLGLADGLDALTAQNALLQARLDALQADQDRDVAFIALYKSLGGAPLDLAAARVPERAPDAAARTVVAPTVRAADAAAVESP